MFHFLIEKYYNIFNFTIINFDDYSIIKKNDKVYYLYHFSSIDPIDFAYKLSVLDSRSYSFVFNVFNQLYTKFENLYYVIILKKDNCSINLLSPYLLNNHYKLSWKNEWIDISSFFESLCFSEIGNNNYIDESISYYLGMLETAIYFLDDFSDDFFCSFIQHKVFIKDFYNPFNYIEDVLERDISEYLKYIFFNQSYHYDEIFALLHKCEKVLNFNLVISRLLYPNYYFREVQSVLINHQSDKKLRQIIARISEFEEYVTVIINEMNKYSSIKKYPFS